MLLLYVVDLLFTSAVTCLFFPQAISNKDQHSISYTLSRAQTVVVEYTHDSNTDMFQVRQLSDTSTYSHLCWFQWDIISTCFSSQMWNCYFWCFILQRCLILFIPKAITYTRLCICASLLGLLGQRLNLFLQLMHRIMVLLLTATQSLNFVRRDETQLKSKVHSSLKHLELCFQHSWMDLGSASKRVEEMQCKNTGETSNTTLEISLNGGKCWERPTSSVLLV